MKIWKLPKEKFCVIILLKKKIFASSKSFWKPFSQLLHYSSMMNILIYREFVWAFNNNHANNNEIFFLCCCSCTNGKIASSCQLCDGYCYNGGTCQLDPETNVPVCLWVFITLRAFYDMTLYVHGIPALLFSILGVTYFKWMFHGHLWSSIVPHWFMYYRTFPLINLLLIS